MLAGIRGGPGARGGRPARNARRSASRAGEEAVVGVVPGLSHALPGRTSRGLLVPSRMSVRPGYDVLSGYAISYSPRCRVQLLEPGAVCRRAPLLDSATSVLDSLYIDHNEHYRPIYPALRHSYDINSGRTHYGDAREDWVRGAAGSGRKMRFGGARSSLW